MNTYPIMFGSFVYDPLPGRVVFGTGSLDKLADEVARLGLERIYLLCTPGRRALTAEVARRLGDRIAGIHDRAMTHVPIELAEEARAEARRIGADGCLAVGGGSTVGLAKAIALELELPIIALPTTYAGSEMTSIWGLTAGGIKRTGRDPRVVPRLVIYDPALTLDLPPAQAAASGMNALAHCVEALYAADANPVTSLLAEEGIRALGRSLPEVVRAPGDLDARSLALYGAWLAGASLAAVSMGIHHKLCHALGGALGLPHAETHAIVLPHATAYNRASAQPALNRVAQALGAADAATGLFDLLARLGLATALRDLGVRESELDRIAELAVGQPYPNPRPVTREGVRALLDDAFHGRRPAV